MLVSKTETIEPYQIPSHWLYAPSTYLLDSWEPFVEKIYLPEMRSKAGEVRMTFIEQGSTTSAKNSSLKLKVKQAVFRKNKLEAFDQSHTILDLRLHSPENLAHAITNHLPVALYAREFLKSIGQVEPVLVFPALLPEYIERLFVSVGFKVLLTDAMVSGKICTFNVSPWISIRGVRSVIVRDTLFDSEFSRNIYNIGFSMPKKIFISRRTTRCLSNEREVEQFLVPRGYQKIYLEDYDILEQIAMVSLADNIVAIHGAALGPLLLRVVFDLPPIKLVELFSPGHMTNVFRMISHQLDGIWVGVRGKLWPEIIKQAYICLPKNTRKYSLVEFEVCLISLKKAMESIEL